MRFFHKQLLTNCKMPEVKTSHASAVWYEDDAGILLVQGKQ